jgi:hypothetical protein
MGNPESLSSGPANSWRQTKTDIEAQVEAAASQNDNTDVKNYLDDLASQGKVEVSEGYSQGANSTVGVYTYKVNGEAVAYAYWNEGPPFWKIHVPQDRDAQYLAFRETLGQLYQEKDLYALTRRLEFEMDHLMLNQKRVTEQPNFVFQSTDLPSATISSDTTTYSFDWKSDGMLGYGGETRDNRFIISTGTSNEDGTHNYIYLSDAAKNQTIVFKEESNGTIKAYFAKKTGPSYYDVPDSITENKGDLITDSTGLERALTPDEVTEYCEYIADYLGQIDYNVARAKLIEDHRNRLNNLKGEVDSGN